MIQNMEFVRDLELQSDYAKYQDSLATPSEFVVKPSAPIELNGSYNYFAAVKNFSSAYTWKNVSEKYRNNVIKLKKPKDVLRRYIITDGTYTYEGLEKFVNREIGDVKDGDGKDVKAFTLEMDFQQLVCVITIAKDCVVDMSEGDLRILLGFNQDNTIFNEGVHFGDTSPQINRGVDTVFVTCSLLKIDDQISFIPKSVLAFDVGSILRGTNFMITQTQPVSYHHIDSNFNITSIQVRVVDEQNVTLDYMGIVNTRLLIALFRSKK